MTRTHLTQSAEAFLAARDFCLRHRADYETALRDFTWPRLEQFNRISPFEIESVLVEHDAVAEAAVVPSLDDIRHSVPKAFVVLAAGFEPTRELAGSILAYAATRLAPYKRVRRIEFADLPKTVSGKIRRVQLRALEHERRTRKERVPLEFFEEEFIAGERRGNS